MNQRRFSLSCEYIAALSSSFSRFIVRRRTEALAPSIFHGIDQITAISTDPLAAEMLVHSRIDWMSVYGNSQLASVMTEAIEPAS